jgi:hypothetical protein
VLIAACDPGSTYVVLDSVVTLANVNDVRVIGDFRANAVLASCDLNNPILTPIDTLVVDTPIIALDV